MKPIRKRLEAWGDHPSSDPNLEAAMIVIADPHHEILWRAFCQQQSPTTICTTMDIKMRPATAFIDAFLASEQALETALKEIEK